MTAGSYDFDDMKCKEKEMEVLRLQAKAMIEFEQGIWSASGLKNGMDVLDMGCGPGNISAELAIYNDAGNVTGLDSSHLLIETAQSYKIKNEIENLKFIVDDIYDLGNVTEKFDFVYCRFVLQHLKNPVTAMEKIRGILKPGGIICIVDIDDQWLSFCPEPSRLKPFLEKSDKYQASKGGDRFVGHKLGEYLSQARFTSISNAISIISSEHIGIKDFLDLTIQSKAVVFDDGDTAQDLENIYSVQKHTSSWGALGIFVATAKKSS